jgi:hypothetical protein
VNGSVSETLVLAKDSTGQLWVTWMEDGDVWLNRSTTADDVWGAPFLLPRQSGSAASDDISAILAFGGDRIGVLWSDQEDDRFFFSVHRDGHADGDWEPRETALVDAGGESIADDHINFATCDATGRLFAAVKTSMPNPEDPEIILLKREPGGAWSHTTWASDFDDHTRPIVVVNCETNTGYVFASATIRGNQEAIFLKATNLDDMAFPPGKGLPFIESEDDEDLNNPTSTKQSVGAVSGLVVLASDVDTQTYLHNTIDFGPAAKPVVFSALPGIAPAGQEITIMGAGFSGATSVEFDGDPASFEVISTAEVRAIVPATAGSGKIRVTTPNGSASSPDDFVVVPPSIQPPAITSFSPASGQSGNVVGIFGSGFTGASSVLFGGTPAAGFAVDADSVISAEVAAGTATGPITVTNAAGTAQSVEDFVYVQITGLPDVSGAPREVRLLANRPNPFASETDVLYETAREGAVRIAIFDVGGRRVATLVDGTRPAGRHSARWDGRDAAGRRVANGVYVVELRAGGIVARRTLTLLR